MNLRTFERDWGVIAKFENGIDLLLARKIIENLSNANRGKLGLQLEKLSKTYENNKNGPLTFSGGVKAFVFGKYVFFVKNNSHFNIFIYADSWWRAIFSSSQRER